jgi:hypothetical protein
LIKSNDLFEILKNNSVTLTSLYLIFEKNENEKNHLHGILVLKNIIDYNLNINNNILNILKNEYELDVVVKNLKNFLDVKN